MKTTKKLLALLLAAVLCMSILSACGGAGSSEAAYKVILVDAMGNPVTSGVVVKFMQNGAQAGMQVVGENGVAEKTLPKGDYTVELQFTGSDVAYQFDAENLTLSAEKTEVQVVLSVPLSSETQTLGVGGKDVEAHKVTVGTTQIPLGTERTYYLFAPAESGTYEFSLIGSDAAIGYYGAPHFVQETSAAEAVDNKFTISVRPDMIGTGNTGTTVLVIGVDAGEGDAVLGIARIGDHEWTTSDEPWTVYEAKHVPSAFTLPAGTIQEFDLAATTDTYKLVTDDKGFYHLDSAEGPLVLVRLGEKATVKYLDPYQVILDHTGVNRYFYKDAEQKEFEKKENYADCLLTYIACVDEESGTYPLTEDLRYIIENNGIQQGWWEEDGNYIFRDEAGNNVLVNKEIAWLFMCCYLQ